MPQFTLNIRARANCAPGRNLHSGGLHICGRGMSSHRSDWVTFPCSSEEGGRGQEGIHTSRLSHGERRLGRTRHKNRYTESCRRQCSETRCCNLCKRHLARIAPHYRAHLLQGASRQIGNSSSSHCSLFGGAVAAGRQLLLIGTPPTVQRPPYSMKGGSRKEACTRMYP